MFLFLYRMFRLLLAAIRGSDSPQQIAFGVALGLVIGLIPKDSLFAYLFCLFVFATSVNLLAASLSTLFFSWLGSFLDPISHQIGLFVLSLESLESTWIWLYQQPIIPWTRFNNTVVLGSLVVGLILLFPVYLSAKIIYLKCAPGVSRWFIRFWIYRQLLGRKKMAEFVGVEP